MEKLNRIKEVLKEQERSQIWLSEKLGKTKTAVNSICRNASQPSLETIYAIANILGVEVGSLLEGNTTALENTAPPNDGTGQTAYTVELCDKNGNALDWHLFRNLHKATKYCKSVGVPLDSDHLQALETTHTPQIINAVWGVGKVARVLLE